MRPGVLRPELERSDQPGSSGQGEVPCKQLFSILFRPNRYLHYIGCLEVPVSGSVVQLGLIVLGWSADEV